MDGVQNLPALTSSNLHSVCHYKALNLPSMDSAGKINTGLGDCDAATGLTAMTEVT